MMSDKKKLILFLGIFIVVNILPFFIVINKVPIYIIWLDNASLTVYLLGVRQKKYRGIGIGIATILEVLHCSIILYTYGAENRIFLSLIVAFLNVSTGFIIYKLLNKDRRLIDTSLQEIINLTFFKVVPSVAILSVLQAVLFEMNTVGIIKYKFYNFFLSDFLGYVFVFTIFYIINKSKEKILNFNSEFFIFFIVIFMFNTEEVYFRNIFNMNRSHLEYISIFILVLSCILLKAEEFLILIIEDFIVSFCMISLFMRHISTPLREYLLSDIQLFYTVVLTTCFFLIILKTENKNFLKEIKIKNKKLGKEVIENREMLKKVDILIDSIKNTAFIANEKGEIVYSNKSFEDKIKVDNIYELGFFREAIEELKNKEARTLRREMNIENLCLMQEIFITKYDDSTFISGIGTDITRLKLIQGKLKKSKEEAEEANRAKSSLLARVSHELKTPMNTITGINYLLLQGDLKVKEREYVKKIESASILLLRMIEDILDVSRTSNSKIKITKSCISLRKVIDTTIFVKEDEIYKKGLKFIHEISEEIPRYVIGDEIRLEQILINLIGNSIKFTSEGYIKLLVELNWKEEERYSIRFTVEDTGIGIAKEKCKKIFEPFMQEDESITRKYGGTGLGLTICKNIVSELEGTIKVESDKGKGTKFVIDIEFLECNYSGNNYTYEKTKNNKKEEILIENKVIEKKLALESLDTLIDYIKNDVGEAMDRLNEMTEIFTGSVYRGEFEQIKALVNEFSLDEAIEKINKLRNEIFRM